MSIVAVAELVECFVHPFQISVDQLIRVEVVEAMGDANQLNIGDGNPENRWKPPCRVDELTRAMRLTCSLLLTYSRRLPLSIHLETTQN